MSASFTGRACGKFILFGDHFVAHGTPALAFPVPGLECEVTVSADGRNDYAVNLLGRPPKAPVIERMKEVTRRACLKLGLEAESSGWSVHSRSNFEISRGFGSSAALSVALLRALLGFLKSRGTSAPDGETTFSILQNMEETFHARPSGIDASTIWHQRPIEFEKQKSPKWVVPKWVMNDTADFILFDAGQRNGTAELVKRIAAYREGHPSHWNGLAARVTTIARSAGAWLSSNGSELKTLAEGMVENHRILSDLGLSSPAVDSVLERARAFGALGGKVSGAGTGGVVVAVSERGRGPEIFKKMRDGGWPAVAIVSAGPM